MLGKLLGFVVNEKEIEINMDKVKAIQELPLSRTQKKFISQLTEKCDIIFRLKKHDLGKTFNKVKHYLSNALVLMPPSPDKPLILYLVVFGNSMECILGQHNEPGRKERAIY
ncbi:RNA-directed DNA polymerase (Reverse transcriptase), Ribonuclease H [Gossypium australe]|uniref:RNA-directed DNA polymerase (Reverse transcriptase), Ribonuclease H n=1 Tax=Gossypium australe TaxID=47621 RepID=A0A5B6VKK5_9ROSI|nr:RNA-directed DNA polymerase (Reverse transcriptase), Ribonuclease H [Gossypium australe]